jgi:hypothetical protein
VARIVVVIFSLFVLTGCALVGEVNYRSNGKWAKDLREQKADEERELKEKHDARVGMTESQIIENIGAPTKSEEVAGFNIWSYYRDNGSTGSGASVGRFISANTMTIQNHFEITRYYFKEGKVVKWDYEKQ